MMWKKLKFLSQYFLKSEIESDYEVFITDYVHLWSVYFTRETFLQCLKESNGEVLIEDSELIERGTQMLSDPDSLKKITAQKDDNIFIVTMTEPHCMLNLNLDFQECSREMFFQKVTKLLLITVCDLHLSQNELRQYIKQKDREIDEYKSEAGILGLRCRKTPIYDDEKHMNKHKSYKENFGTSDIPVSLLETTVAEAPKIKQEDESNVAVKLEVSNSQSAETVVHVKSEIKPEPQSSPVNSRKRAKKINY